MTEVIKHSYTHGCQMELLTRNGTGQTCPSGGQYSAENIQLGRQSVVSQVQGDKQTACCRPRRRHLALEVPWMIAAVSP